MPRYETSRQRCADLEIAVTRFAGTSDGPAFVLVHGIGVSGRYFRPAAEELSKSGTVYLVDLPGYGSAPNPRRDVSIADHARVLADFLRQTQLVNPVLVGHSMGTQVVARLALDAPDVTDRIVLLGPTMAPAARSVAAAATLLLRDILREPLLVNLIVVSDYLFRCGIPYFFRQLPHLLGDHLEAYLPGVSARTLIVRGDRDVIVPRAWAGRLAAIASDGAYREVDGPHVIMFTDPVGVAALIVEHSRRREQAA